jgi:tRNA modification GTPase
VIRNDTIVARSTALGEAALAVIRLTGSEACEITQKLLKQKKKLADQIVRQATLTKVYDLKGNLLDEGLLLRFKGPHSYTGEDSIEFQGHGGKLVAQRVVEAFVQAGARLAEPGEFTQRAFLNGKLDLTQAEAVMDVIHAQSDLALKAAQAQLNGSLGQRAEKMRQAVIEVVAHLEAYIDFPEEDISPEVGIGMRDKIKKLIEDTEFLLATAEQGRVLREGARTAIVGMPNAGKSSLMNLLVGYDRAIVSPIAGTTRDTVSEWLQVEGIALQLVDTAGLRESADEVEQLGIERTLAAIESADLLLEVVDGTQSIQQTQRCHIPERMKDKSVLVLNKTDIGIHSDWVNVPAVNLSCVSGRGLLDLRHQIHTILQLNAEEMKMDTCFINTRHRCAFEQVKLALSESLKMLETQAPVELTALHLREALDYLGEVVGRTDIESILDVVFSSFCIGK